MTKIKFITAAVLSALFTACSPINSVEPFDQKQAAILVKEWYVKKPAQQRISLNLPQRQNWKRIDMSQNGQGSPIMLIPINQTESNWDESIRTDLAPYIKNADITAEKYVQQQIQSTHADCEQSDANILARTNQAVIYRINNTKCTTEEHGMQIGKAFNGQDAVYVVYYTATNNKLSPKHLNQLTHVIADAQLTINPHAD